MMTALVIGGASLLALGIGYLSGRDNQDNDSAETSNNPYSRWEENQPYNP